jgi:DNA-binding response OmpR family regulator
MNPDRVLSVVLVEDDHALLSVWQQLFELLGHKIVGCHTGRQLLDLSDTVAQADLLITDYYLPDFNGVELVKKVRAVAPNLPTIILTGSREDFIREAALELAHCHILYKPLNIADIEAKIDEIFSAPESVTGDE